MSFGVAAFDPAVDKTPLELFKRADRAVYGAKDEGRDLVCVNVKGILSIYERTNDGTNLRPIPSKPVSGLPEVPPETLKNN